MKLQPPPPPPPPLLTLLDVSKIASRICRLLLHSL
jgi:hypothetical protein